MVSKIILFFMFFNIMFLTSTHADLIPDFHMPHFGIAPAPSSIEMAPAPSPLPLDPGMTLVSSDEGLAPSPAQGPIPLDPSKITNSPHLDPSMASAPNASPLDPALAPAPAPAPDSNDFLGIELPPTIGDLNLNCSGCPIDPFGLAACVILVTGDLRPDTIGYCCSTLGSLSREVASACLCHAIKIKAIKIGDFDVGHAIRLALVGCGKMESAGIEPHVPLGPT